MSVVWPRPGQLWIWRGNEYEVVSVHPRSDYIVLREIGGGGERYTQHLSGDSWGDPIFLGVR